MVQIADPLEPHLSLITAFLDRTIGAPRFERAYLDLYKRDDTAWTAEAFDVLDGLFAEVDEYTPYPDLRDPGDPTDDDLRDQARHRLERLSALRDPPSVDDVWRS